MLYASTEEPVARYFWVHGHIKRQQRSNLEVRPLRNDLEVGTALEGAASLITEADLVNPRKVSRHY
jgi:hypothetical protein